MPARRPQPTLHVQTQRALEVRDAVARLVGSGGVRVAWPRNGWTTIVGEPGAALLDLAVRLSEDLGCRTALVRVDEADAFTCWLHEEGRERALLEGSPEATDDPEVDLPPGFGAAPRVPDEEVPRKVASLPGAGGRRREAAARFVRCMQEQVRLEVAGNVEWLRRHQALHGLAVPAVDEIDRDEERSLVAGALTRLRRLMAGPREHEAVAAVEELRGLLGGQREAFHALVSAHGDLLGLPELPAPAEAPPAYFAAIEEIIGAGGRPPTRGEATPLDSLAEALGLDGAILRGAPGALALLPEP